MNDDSPELDAVDFGRAISAHLRRRLVAGQIESGDDVVAIRRFVGLEPEAFARATGISLEMLDAWESGTQKPAGPAVSLLRIAARHPGVFRENIESPV